MITIAEGLARLGKKRMLLAIHDVSFPADADEDLGRGSPATRAAERLFAYAAKLGFTGLQLGPQGQTSRDNPSPYDGTIFSRNVANLGLDSLRTGGEFAGLVGEDVLAAAIDAGGGIRARHVHAYDASQTIVAAAFAGLAARPDLRARFDAFRATQPWLVRDALYAVIASAYFGRGTRDWSARDRALWLDDDPRRTARRDQLIADHAVAIERYAFGQFLVHAEHARVRTALARAQLVIYGDLQVGYSDGDAWAYAAAFLRDHRLGAPPSRTNPEGQPWGYPVLDPDQLEGDRRAARLVIARVDKAFAEYDSIRLDHPHGLVCPWVYDAHAADPGDAVRHGARLHESPDLAGLAHFAIARADQLDHRVPRYDDAWVIALDDDQVTRYAVLLDAIVDSAHRNGRDAADVSCEVLSTMPRPLERVLARHRLGRWRITQKANLDDPRDVYRAEHVAPADWVMLGNHDTAPIFGLIAQWPAAKREQWARHLAATLALPDPAQLAHPGFFATAMLAELLASRADNVSIFFSDLFGYEERFNVPGVVDPANWTLRLPADFEQLHARRLAANAALDLPLAIDLALAARTSRAGSGA